MTEQDLKILENALLERGYRKITGCKIEMDDDYELYKAFRDDEGELRYQIFFEVWDFRKYDSPHIGVSVTVSPESCKNNVGRRDLKLSVDWTDNVDKVERTAEEFYNLITKIDNYV